MKVSAFDQRLVGEQTMFDGYLTGLPGAASAWTISGGVNFQTATAKRNNSGSINVEQGTYALWSAAVAYQINRHVTASLHVTNLFDKTYYRTIGAAGGNWYGEPLSATATLRALF